MRGAAPGLLAHRPPADMLPTVVFSEFCCPHGPTSAQPPRSQLVGLIMAPDFLNFRDLFLKPLILIHTLFLLTYNYYNAIKIPITTKARKL